MISVIIPVYNEAKTIQSTINYVFQNASYRRLLQEVIVVDGGSNDNTVEEAEKTGATVMISPRKGRAAQSNYGASQASGKILYFLQSHSLPPENFISEIVKANSKGYSGGTFSLKFDYKHWLLNTLSWITNNATWIYLSDQSLFVTKELFVKAGGFKEDHFVMANQEIIGRLKRYTNFIVMKASTLTSAAKFLRYGVFKTQAIQGLAYLLHSRGFSQDKLTFLYRKFLRWEIGTIPLSRKDKSRPSVQTKLEAKKDVILSQ